MVKLWRVYFFVGLGLDFLCAYIIHLVFDVSRYKGKVVAVKYRKETSAKVKVKFDSYQKDKYDKW